MKRCSRCKIEKPFEEFHKRSISSDGYYHMCRTCKSQYYKENREKELKNRHIRYLEKKEETLKQNKQWKEENKEYYHKQQKEYRQSNKEKINIKSKKWIKNNRERINQTARKLDRKKKKTNTQYRLKKRLRVRLYSVLKSGCKVGSAVRDLGCSVEDLKIWLEQQFLPGMTWENYGNGEGKWNIDHILPLSKFDLTDRKQLLKVCNWFNLRPMWAMENIKKSNKI